MKRDTKKEWRAANPRRALISGMIIGARARSRRAGIPFDLTPADIHIPHRCPVLGIVLRKSVGTADDRSPTLDRIVPRLGYVRDNVVVVSSKANRIKSDANPAELERVAAFYRQLCD